MTTEWLKRIDADAKLRKRLLPYCRQRHGHYWQDSISGDRVGVLNATLTGPNDNVSQKRKLR